MAITLQQIEAILNAPQIDMTPEEFTELMVSLGLRHRLLKAQSAINKARQEADQAQQDAAATIQTAQAQADAVQAQLDTYLASLGD